jgi:hypothetical protein
MPFTLHAARFCRKFRVFGQAPWSDPPFPQKARQISGFGDFPGLDCWSNYSTFWGLFFARREGPFRVRFVPFWVKIPGQASEHLVNLELLSKL